MVNAVGAPTCLITPSANPDGVPAAEQRLFSRPADPAREGDLCAEWKSYVEPDLRDILFARARRRRIEALHQLIEIVAERYFEDQHRHRCSTALFVERAVFDRRKRRRIDAECFGEHDARALRL